MAPPVTATQTPLFLRSDQLVSNMSLPAATSHQDSLVLNPKAAMDEGTRVVKENQSFDSSVMINGDSIGTSIQTQNNYTNYNNYVNVTVQKSKRRRDKAVVADKPQIVNLPQTHVQKETLKVGSLTSPIRVLKLRSNIDDSRVPVYARDDWTLQSNWISAKIVRRLGLKCKKSSGGAFSAGRNLVSNGQFVMLSTSGVIDAQGHKVYEKFHVVEEASFDVLYGKLE